MEERECVCVCVCVSRRRGQTFMSIFDDGSLRGRRRREYGGVVNGKWSISKQQHPASLCYERGLSWPR